jgi:hypothetical protein
VESSDDEDLPSFSRILKKSDVYDLSNNENESKSTEITNNLNETEFVMLTQALEMSTKVERYNVL